MLSHTLLLEACLLSTIVYRISVLLRAIVAEVPVGTTLGLFWLLCALISGRCLRSPGAVFPALADGGMPAEAVRRSGAALAYGRWAIQTLVSVWQQVVQREGRWQAARDAGFRLVVCDLVGFFRPRLCGCVGTHDHSGADTALLYCCGCCFLKSPCQRGRCGKKRR